MARLIRRHSMERLELYDLDKLITIPQTDYQLPPPIPPPRKHRRPSINPAFERYQFLCNTTRSKTDPVYAATPMFTTIPQSSQEKSHRQVIGTYIRLEHVKSLPITSAKSPEPKKAEVIEDPKEEEEKEEEEEIENEDDNDNDNVENDDDENPHSSSSSSSSSDEQENINDDDNDKGVVEQIFNRHKKD